jgi:hypothetical protein
MVPVAIVQNATTIGKNQRLLGTLNVYFFEFHGFCTHLQIALLHTPRLGSGRGKMSLSHLSGLRACALYPFYIFGKIR